MRKKNEGKNGTAWRAGLCLTLSLGLIGLSACAGPQGSSGTLTGESMEEPSGTLSGEDAGGSFSTPNGESTEETSEGIGTGSRENGEKLKVVSTLFPYYDFARQIGGDLIELNMVIPAGMDSHSFEPTPADIRLIESADLLICNGGAMEHWVEQVVDALEDPELKVITMMDYVDVVERLADADVDMLEINISCPNVKEGGIAFGQDPKCAEQITKAVKKVARQPVIMKLSPNVTDIAEMARAVEAGGADVVSLINTLTGMKIDVQKRAFVLANKTGGLSGPAIKPVAVRMVYQTANAVKIPVIGMGGIMTAEDALEFILAGATAVAVGTANFIDPETTVKVAEGIEEYMRKNHVEDINELVGAVR